ncbi:MAG: hypothetical protein OCD76_15770 [Reichenbachiella sp.]
MFIPKIYITLFLLLPIFCYGQDNFEELLNDKLSQERCGQLNQQFEKERGIKDFCSMKVAFFSSPGGTIQRTSLDYFETMKLYNTDSPFIRLIFFDQEELEVHGYGAAIIWGSKNYNPNVNKQLKKLAKKKVTNKV